MNTLILATFLFFIFIVKLKETILVNGKYGDQYDAIISAPKNQMNALSEFNVIGKITKYVKKSPSLVIDVEEYHSNKLRMSYFLYKKHHFYNNNFKQLDEFYSVDSEQLLKVNRFNWTCERKSHHEMFLHETFEISNSIENASDTTKSAATILFSIFSNKIAYLTQQYAKPPEHIAGLANLLYLIDLNRDKMKSLNVQLYIQSQLYSLYRLNLTLKHHHGREEFSEIKLHAYFPVNNNDAQFPRRIKLELTNNNSSVEDIMIDFLQFNSNKNADATLRGAAKHLETFDQYQLDKFSVDPRFGCAKMLGSLNSINAMQVPRTASMRFEAVNLVGVRGSGVGVQAQQLGAAAAAASNGKQFVAYDGGQAVFRRDVLLMSPSSSNLVTTKTKQYSITIHDLKWERKYNFREGQCVAAQTSKSLYEPLFPFSGFSYLGTGRVRGIKVDIYEHHIVSCTQLPAIFYSSSIEFCQTNKNNDEKTLIVVYYFATQIDREIKILLGPLMRVDIYLEGKGELVGQINVYEFAWKLQQSPMGDYAHELFVLPNECLIGRQSYGLDVKLELEFKQKKNLNKEEEEASLSVEQVVEIFSSYNQIIRNNLFKTALASQTGLSTTQMSSFNCHLSSIKQKQMKFRAYIATKLLQMSKHIELNLYQFSDVANVSLRSKGRGRSRSKSMIIEAATTFEECFFEVAHRKLHQRGEPVLFAFYENNCYFDSKPIFEIDKQTKRIVYTYSNVFEINIDNNNNNNSIESRKLFKVNELLIEKALPIIMAQPLDEQLSGHNLIIPLPSSNQKSVATFEVEHVDLIESIETFNSDLYSGFSLINGKSIKFNSDSNQINGNNFFINCQSACLSDLNCWSFSICINQNDLESTSECLISDTNLEKISNREVALQPNKRCQTYAKRSLELFSQLRERNLITFSNKSISKYVSNLEECAEKCLELNGLILNKNDKLSLRNWCSKFEYIALKELKTIIPQEKIVDFFDKFLNEKYNIHEQYKQENGGICILNYRDEKEKVEILANKKQEGTSSSLNSLFKANVDSYEFKFNQLYERQLGNIRMVEFSPFVSLDLTDNSSEEKEEEEERAKFINKRKFLQTSSVDLCARECFLQQIEQFQCKSFDFIQIKVGKISHQQEYGLAAAAAATTTTMFEQELESKQFISSKTCVLNSMNFADAKASGHFNDIVLITNNTSDYHSSWHYELLPAYSMIEGKISRDDNYLSIDVNQSVHLWATWRSYGEMLLNILIILTAIASGHIIAMKSSRTISSFPATKKRESDFNLDLQNIISEEG